jgi:hypothetical protein
MELRKDVIGLTDAWGIPDFIHKAPIGRYDGDIYPGKHASLRMIFSFCILPG